MRLSVDVRGLSSALTALQHPSLVRVATLAVVVALLLTSALPAATKVQFVDYSQEVFDTARRDGKPVFLLISAAWCYWCKYFDRNILEGDDVATYLNQHYHSVLVDHDRRTDLVRRYVRGLPMIVLFGPDGQVRQSFAGALTKQDFLDVVKRVADDVRTQAAAPVAPQRGTVASLPSAEPVTREAYQQLRDGLFEFVKERLDPVYGGFGRAEKHPQPRLLRYLLAQYRVTRDRRYLSAVERTLDATLKNLYDGVDGGFFRYAEAREWGRPHYEKLLYVNAALAQALDDAYRSTQKPQYRHAADSTIAYLRRTLYDAKDGGFYGSQTADPSYYSLAPNKRRATAKPPVIRDKVTAWNAEAVIALLAMGQSENRKDLIDVAHRTLEFMRRALVTERGAFQLFDAASGRGQLSGQLEANAWAALAFFEGHRVLRDDGYRDAAERVLGYAKAHLLIKPEGVFVEGRNVPVSLGANGLLAEALVRAYRLNGRADDLALARRVLAALGGVARALLVDDVDVAEVSRVSDAVAYLTAYGSVVERR